MVICKFFLEGRCRYGDRCWNEHPRGGGGGGGRRQEQSRYDYQAPPASSRWTSSSYNQRYVQPSSFSKSTTWTRDDNQPTFASHSESHDNKSRQYNAAPPAGHFSQNRFSTLSSQDHSREAPSDKDGNIFETIKHDLDLWESSGQWIFSSYCVRDERHITGFTDLSPEELRLECYTARNSGNMQNYINTVQQLASQWKQRMHAIRNTNISSQSALLNELTKPATSSAPTFGGQQTSGFPTTSSSTSTATKSTVNFNFKQDSQFPAPSKGPISGFPSASGFGNKPATGFGNAAAGSAASFSFAAPSNGGASGFSNANTVTAATFSFAPTASSSAATSAFSGFGAAATAAPASTSSTTTAPPFGGTAAPFGGTAAPFGGTTATFGGSVAPFGGTTATSGGSTAPFGGTTATSGGSTAPFGGTTATSGGSTTPFGGTTAVSGFGQSATSTFGGASSTFGFGVPAGNAVTSGFGTKTSVVSDLFKAGAASSTTSVPFGQASGFSVSNQPSVTTTAEASSENPIFTPRSELSARELSQFEAKRFTLGNIPLLPPPANLLAV